MFFEKFNNNTIHTLAALITIISAVVPVVKIFRNNKMFNDNLSLLKEKINNNEIGTPQFYLSLENTCQSIKKDKNHINELKIILNDKCLLTIFKNDDILNCNKENSNSLYKKIKFFIEEYSLFQNLQSPKNKNCKKYKISAFLGNNELMPYRISLETNPKELIKYIGGDTDTESRKEVALNKHTDIDTLEYLSEDISKEVRYAVAHNEKSTEKILEVLATDKECSVREAVASNEAKTTQKILKILANDKEYSVRLSVATNKNLPNELMIKLAEDKNIEVRKGIIQRSDCPTEIKIKILENSNYDHDCCKVVIKDDKTPAIILNKILYKTKTLYMNEIISHKNTNKKVFGNILNIINKNIILNYKKEKNDKYQKYLAKEIDIDNRKLLIELLKTEKFYQYKNVLKQCLYLYIKNFKFEQNICDGFETEIIVFRSKIPNGKECDIILIILEYLKENRVDEEMFYNMRIFISFSNYKLNNKEEIKEKINKIEKLNTKQKDALIKALSL